MNKKMVITAISVGTAALHFVKSENYRGPFALFVNGYMIDIVLPMTLVLLMGLLQNKILRSIIFRACVVFITGCLVEFSQFAGVPIFGSTFDPLDILAYAGGCFSPYFLTLYYFRNCSQHGRINNGSFLSS